MDEPQPTPDSIPVGTCRKPALFVALAVAIVLFLGREVLRSWPLTTRVIVENHLPETIGDFEIKDSSRTIRFGSMPSYGPVVLAIDFQPGERYGIHGQTLSGDEILSQIVNAREERRDVHIVIWKNGEGFHYVSIEEN